MMGSLRNAALRLNRLDVHQHHPCPKTGQLATRSRRAGAPRRLTETEDQQVSRPCDLPRRAEV
jgi:hypothetical protein